MNQHRNHFPKKQPIVVRLPEQSRTLLRAKRREVAPILKAHLRSINNLPKDSYAVPPQHGRARRLRKLFLREGAYDLAGYLKPRRGMFEYGSDVIALLGLGGA